MISEGNKELQYLKFLDYRDVAKVLKLNPNIYHRDLGVFLNTTEANIALMSKNTKAKRKRLLMMLGLSVLAEKGIIQVGETKRQKRIKRCEPMQ